MALKSPAGAGRFSTAPAPGFSAAGKTLGRVLATCTTLSKDTVAKALPAYMGRTACSLPPSRLSPVTSAA